MYITIAEEMLRNSSSKKLTTFTFFRTKPQTFFTQFLLNHPRSTRRLRRQFKSKNKKGFSSSSSAQDNFQFESFRVKKEAGCNLNFYSESSATIHTKSDGTSRIRNEKCNNETTSSCSKEE